MRQAVLGPDIVKLHVSAHSDVTKHNSELLQVVWKEKYKNVIKYNLFSIARN